MNASLLPTGVGLLVLSVAGCDGAGTAFHQAPTLGDVCKAEGVEIEGTAASGVSPATEGEECMYFVDLTAPEQPRGKVDKPRTRLVYLNDQGGIYTPGDNDAARNTSSIIPSEVVLAPQSLDEEEWSQYEQCVESKFARFNIDFTRHDPGDRDHVEAVLAEHPCQLALGSKVRGVAPISPRCDIIERAVVYVFRSKIDDIETLCEVTAHEVGHALGLDHQYLCEDPMTYLRGCGQKSFQEIDAACGTKEPRQCHCGGDRQNTVDHLFAGLGPRVDGDFVPPQVALLSPSPNAQHPAQSAIEVVAEARDDVALATAKLVWRQQGDEIIVDCSEPPSNVTCMRDGDQVRWRFDVSTGERELAIRAVDRAGNVSTTPFQRLVLSSAVD